MRPQDHGAELLDQFVHDLPIGQAGSTRLVPGHQAQLSPEDRGQSEVVHPHGVCGRSWEAENDRLTAYRVV